MTTERKLSPSALAISADLQEVISFKETSNHAGDDSIYVKHAVINGLEMETVNKVKDYDRTFGAGLMDATAVVALKAVQADPSKKETKFEVSVKGAHGEEFAATYTGERSGVMAGKDGAADKPWTSYGSVRLAHKSVTAGKRSDLGIAMNIAEAAAEAALKAAVKG